MVETCLQKVCWASGASAPANPTNRIPPDFGGGKNHRKGPAVALIGLPWDGGGASLQNKDKGLVIGAVSFIGRGIWGHLSGAELGKELRQSGAESFTAPQP